MITVVGMGRNVGDLTLDGAEAIKNADVVVVKSQLTHAAEAVSKIRDDALYCDDLFEQAADFDNLNNLIVERLQSFGERKVAFCVVGDGVDDTTAQCIPKARLIGGVGLHTAVMPTNSSGVRIYTAQELCAEKYVLPVTTVVKCIDDKYLASDVQLRLLSAFDRESTVVISTATGRKTITLSELAKQRFDYKTTICVFPRDLTSRQVFGYYDAVEILSILRSENGCPWDRAQTHLSITKNAIEEAYELVNALNKQDNDNVVEELGDLLMQVLFHIEIGQDNGEFEPAAVYSALCRKLVDRHPHVFGEVHAENADAALDVWTAQKMKEHKIKNVAENVLDVPVGMSALMRAQKVQSRASKGDFDFKNRQQILDKLQEELQEFINASEEERQMEGGDLLFVVVNLLRFCGVDSETSLIDSTDKFVRRVVECERLLALRGQKLADLTGEQFDEVWHEAKQNVG